MALRAGYYGIKNKLLKQLINIPAQIVGKADASLLATVQTELTASRAYAVGEQFVYNGLLYKVTQAIASGGDIIIDTNAELAPSVSEQINGVIKSFTFSGTLAANGTVGFTLPADGKCARGALCSIDEYVSISLLTQVGESKGLILRKTDGSIPSGTYQFRVFYTTKY